MGWLAKPSQVFFIKRGSKSHSINILISLCETVNHHALVFNISIKKEYRIDNTLLQGFTCLNADPATRNLCSVAGYFVIFSL